MWPFTATETAMLMTTLSAAIVAVIAAIKGRKAVNELRRTKKALLLSRLEHRKLQDSKHE